MHKVRWDANMPHTCPSASGGGGRWFQTNEKALNRAHGRRDQLTPVRYTNECPQLMATVRFSYQDGLTQPNGRITIMITTNSNAARTKTKVYIYTFLTVARRPCNFPWTFEWPVWGGMSENIVNTSPVYYNAMLRRPQWTKYSWPAVVRCGALYIGVRTIHELDRRFN